MVIRRNEKYGGPEAEADLVDTKSIKKTCVFRIE